MNRNTLERVNATEELCSLMCDAGHTLIDTAKLIKIKKRVGRFEAKTIRGVSERVKDIAKRAGELKWAADLILGKEVRTQ